MISLDDIWNLKPCWSIVTLQNRVPPGGTTYADIASADDVSLADRRWLLTQLAARTKAGRSVLVLWAAECANSVFHLVPESCRATAVAAIQAAINWAHNPTGASAAALTAAAAHAAARAARAAYAADAARAAAYAARAADAAYAAADAADAADAQLLSLASALEALHV